MTVRWHIMRATALPGHRLALLFADGLAGELALSASDFTGALVRLADDQYFAQVKVVDGVPIWPDGEDLAPDALYEDVRTARALA